MPQMVCGSCRRLLSYPQGAKHVRCTCCQIINFVLEGTTLSSFSLPLCFRIFNSLNQLSYY